MPDNSPSSHELLNPSLAWDKLDFFLIDLANRLKSLAQSPQAIIQCAENQLDGCGLEFFLEFAKGLEFWGIPSEEAPTVVFRHLTENAPKSPIITNRDWSGNITLALEVAMLQMGDTAKSIIQGRYKSPQAPASLAGNNPEERWVVRQNWLGALRRVYKESERELSLPPLVQSPLPQAMVAACLEVGESLMRLGIYPPENWECNDVEIPTLLWLSNKLLQFQNKNGLQIGRFKLMTRVGQGGYGVVYRAFDEKLRREVAIKISKAFLDGSGDGREAALREARAAARLNHQGIVPLLDILDLPDQVILVSAFVQGKSLSQWLKDFSGMVPVAIAVEWTIAMAKAMAHAHARGVLHCDLKPGNILLEIPKGTPAEIGIIPRIGDFGLSKMTHATATLTSNNQGIGTPMYMAPEQFQGREGLTTACDIYSLGTILYEMLAKRRPYRSGTMAELLREVLEKPPLPLEESRPGLHPDLKAICQKCLEKPVAARYTTMEELAQDLERFQAGKPTTARPLGKLGTFSRWYWNNLLLANSMALVLLSLAVSTVVFILLYGEVTIQAKNFRLQKDRADVLANYSNRERKLSDRRYYASEMRAIQTAFENGQIALATERLGEVTPEKLGWEDFRSFEWHYWKRRTSLPHQRLAAYPDFGMDLDLSSQNAVLWLKDSGVAVLQTNDGMEKARFPGGKNPCFDSQGKLLAYVDESNRVRVLDAGTLVEKLSFPALPSVRTMFFLGREKLVVVGLLGWKIHDCANGLTLNSHSLGENISYLKGCMIDQHRFALSTSTPVIQIWTVQKDPLLEECPCEGKLVQTMRASPSGDRLAWSVYPPRIFSRDVPGKRNLWSKEVKDNFIFAMGWSPDGKKLAWGGSNQVIHALDAGTGDDLSSWTTQNMRLTKSIQWNLDGRLWSLANQFNPGKTELISWDDTLEKSFETLYDANTPVLGFSLDSHGAKALIATERLGVRIVSIPQGKLLHSHSFNSPPIGQTFHPMMERFLIILKNGELWGIDTLGQAALVFSKAEMPTTASGQILVSPSGEEVALGLGLGGMEIFRLKDGKSLGKFQSANQSLEQLVQSHDKSNLLMGQKNGPLVHISWKNASLVETLMRSPSEVTCAAVSPSGKHLGIIQGLTQASVFELPGLQATPEFRKFRTNLCKGIFWTRDSNRLVGYDMNGFIRFWDSVTGQEILQIRAHDNHVVEVLEIPSRKQFLSLGKYGDLKLWDGETRK